MIKAYQLIVRGTQFQGFVESTTDHLKVQLVHNLVQLVHNLVGSLCCVVRPDSLLSQCPFQPSSMVPLTVLRYHVEENYAQG